MKIKMSEALELQAIYPKIKSQQLSISTTYKLLKLFTSVDTEAQFYRDNLSQLIDKYGARDDDGQIIANEDNSGVQIARDHISDFQKEFQELLTIEIEVPEVSFTLKELDNLSISLEEFNCLFPFIKDE